MKNKYLISCVLAISCLGVYLFYILLTTSILLKTLKTNGYITSDMSYRFASSSVTGQSLVLYHLEYNKWPGAFIHRAKISLNQNGFDLTLKDIHFDSSQLALKYYGAYLPDVLDSYQVVTHFIENWPLSVTLFDLITPHTTIDINLQQKVRSSFYIKITLKQKGKVVLTASATIVATDTDYDILYAQAHLHDKTLLKLIQGYAASRHQIIPTEDFNYPVKKNPTRTDNPENLK